MSTEVKPQEITEVIETYHNDSDSSLKEIKKEDENSSDLQIDELLKEVEQIRHSSPIKLKPNTELVTGNKSTESSPDSTIISNNANSSTESIKDEVAELPNINKTSETKSNIPKSVSQALFSSALKVTKIREKEVAPKFLGLKTPPNPESAKRLENLQKRDYELTKKIQKLNKEINYLKNLIETAGISSDLNELRKLKYAIERLEDYLDQKQKEKYEIGMQITRAVRKRIDSGESGEFWVN